MVGDAGHRCVGNWMGSHWCLGQNFFTVDHLESEGDTRLDASNSKQAEVLCR